MRAARLLYRWQRGEIPKGWTLDRTCRRHWCVEMTHLEPITRAEHARREAERKRQDQAAALEAPAPTQALKAAPAQRFEIALFVRIDRPAVERRTVDLADLVKL